ncbi:LytTR family DNA-binding domain-containing protein [Gangjinia marincola]
MIGYLRLGACTRFPVKEFILFTALFTGIRFTFIYFFLSNHLPSYTVFHYPRRALPFTMFSSAGLLFLGYSYAIYQWGLAAREKYKERFKESGQKLEQPIKLRCGGKTIYVLSQDILYLNANGEYVDYNTLSRKYTCFKRLKVAEAEMNPLGFIRTHRSYIINPNYVEAVALTEVTLKGNISIPLSKKYKVEVHTFLENLLKRE